VNCSNTGDNKIERDKAMRATLERNPVAFDPKIAKEVNSEMEGSSLHHTRGCHCKKSGCQKKYCECFQSGARCTALCKCEECKNMEPINMISIQQRIPLRVLTLDNEMTHNKRVIGTRKTIQKVKQINRRSFKSSQEKRLRSTLTTRSNKRFIA